MKTQKNTKVEINRAYLGNLQRWDVVDSCFNDKDWRLSLNFTKFHSPSHFQTLRTATRTSAACKHALCSSGMKPLCALVTTAADVMGNQLEIIGKYQVGNSSLEMTVFPLGSFGNRISNGNPGPYLSAGIRVGSDPYPYPLNTMPDRIGT